MAIIAETAEFKRKRTNALGWAAFRIVLALQRGEQPRTNDLVAVLRYLARGDRLR